MTSYLHEKIYDSEEELHFIRSSLLENEAGLVHAFTTRRGGVSHEPFDALNLSPKTGDENDSVRRNIEILKNSLMIRSPLLFLNQVHGSEVLDINCMKDYDGTSPYDAIITSEREIPLMILTADCLPLLFYDPQLCVIGATHAGWKGTSMEIAKKTVAAMSGKFGSDPSDIRVSAGPSIGPCCYEVDHEVVDSFIGTGKEAGKNYSDYFDFFRPVPGKSGKYYMDLSGANRFQLLDAGLKENNISLSSLCTSCRNDLFFSYRRDGCRTGRQGALIMMFKYDGKGKIII